MRRGDPINTQFDGINATGIAVWEEGEYTPYADGFFGFRSTHSHHVIRDFKVYRLVPLENAGSECAMLRARPESAVRSH